MGLSFYDAAKKSSNIFWSFRKNVYLCTVHSLQGEFAFTFLFAQSLCRIRTSNETMRAILITIEDVLYSAVLPIGYQKAVLSLAENMDGLRFLYSKVHVTSIFIKDTKTNNNK